MIVKAPAKINLVLDILKKLDSGYHSLFMVMQAVELFDKVTVDRNTSGEISLSCNNKKVPCNEKNIAYKCANAFYDHFNIKDRGISIYIEKNIPMAAGLAGGSADGAAVLYCLNKLYNVNASNQVICSIGSAVGADIPFSYLGGSALVLGTGGVIAPIKSIDGCYIVIVKPDQDVSTPLAYKKYDELEWVRHLDRVSVLEAVEYNDHNKLFSLCGNVFEQAVEIPDRPHIKSVMRKHECVTCCMSGSGPSVFGIFTDKALAEKCANELRQSYDNVFLSMCYPHGITEV